jgi:hypothetical protein
MRGKGKFLAVRSDVCFTAGDAWRLGVSGSELVEVWLKGILVHVLS